MKKIRLYGCQKEMVETYQKLYELTGVEVFSVSDKDLDKSLNEVFANQMSTEENHEFDDMFMLLQGFNTEEMLHYLKTLKEYAVPFGGIKVMETIHNRNWKLRDLLSEVKVEHELFQKCEVLKQVLISASQVNLDSMAIDIQTSFKNQLMKSYMILQSPNKSLESIEESIRECLGLLKNCK